MGNENSSYYDSDRESDFVRVEDVRVDAKDDEDEAQQISLARELSLVERDKMARENRKFNLDISHAMEESRYLSESSSSGFDSPMPESSNNSASSNDSESIAFASPAVRYVSEPIVQSVTETVREQALSVTILQNQQQASLALAEATAENEKFKKYVLELEESLSTMEMKYEFERFQMISDHRDEMLKLTESYKSEFKSLEEKCKSCTICLEQFDDNQKRMCCFRNCGHSFCKSCIRVIATNNNAYNDDGPSCPTCRKRVSRNQIIDVF